MLVNLKNTGAAPRIIYDSNSVMRTVAVGKVAEVDLAMPAVKKYETAQRMGDTMTITRLENEDGDRIEENEDPAAEREGFTLAEGEGLDKPEKTNKDGTPKGTPAGLNADQPKSRQEAEGGRMPKPPEQEERRVRVPPDRIKAVAQQAATGRMKPAKPPGDPTTATGVLEIHERGMLEGVELLRLANKVLPKSKLPQRPKPSQIIAALQEQAKVEKK